ncbi:putative transposase [Sinorhizobium medicae]
MVDESNAGPVAPAVVADAEVKAPTGKKRSSSRPQKAPPEPAQPKMPAAKRRGYSEQERSEKLRLIETKVSEGNILKDAIKSAGISEQTYYHWKGAAKSAARKDIEGARSR